MSSGFSCNGPLLGASNRREIRTGVLVCNPPFLVATLPSSTHFQAEGLIVCAPRYSLMAELARLHERLQEEICRKKDRERVFGSRVRTKSGESQADCSQFARLELSISTFSQRVMLVRPRKACIARVSFVCCFGAVGLASSTS